MALEHVFDDGQSQPGAAAHPGSGQIDPIESFGQAGDVLVVFTTSGNSANIRLALEQARRAGVVTVGLLGKDGGTCRGLCDVPVVAPGGTPDLIQECHQVIMHLLLEAVEADDAPAG